MRPRPRPVAGDIRPRVWSLSVSCRIVLGLRHRPGLTGRRLAATVAGGDRHDRAETDIGAAKAEGRRQLSAGARRWMPHVRFWSQFWSHSPTSGAVHGDRRPAVRAGQGRWRPMVDAHAQSSKACEGATLPWVQIPPPPPLTCKNAGPGSPQAGAPWSGGLIWRSHLRAAGAPPAGSAAAVAPGHGRPGPT